MNQGLEAKIDRPSATFSNSVRALIAVNPRGNTDVGHGDAEIGTLLVVLARRLRRRRRRLCRRPGARPAVARLSREAMSASCRSTSATAAGAHRRAGRPRRHRHPAYSIDETRQRLPAAAVPAAIASPAPAGSAATAPSAPGSASPCRSPAATPAGSAGRRSDQVQSTALIRCRSARLSSHLADCGLRISSATRRRRASSCSRAAAPAEPRAGVTSAA